MPNLSTARAKAKRLRRRGRHSAAEHYLRRHGLQFGLPPPWVSEQPSIRHLAHKVVNRLSEDELRRIQLPLGAVFDSLYPS